MKEDLNILEGCKKGDQKAQALLYHRYKAKLFVLCLRYADSYEEAEDFLQDGFIHIFKDLYRFQPFGSLEAWMRKVVVNVALQHIRKKRRLFQTTEISPMISQLESNENPFSDLSAKNLIRMIQTLPTGYRTVFNLFVIEGYSHQEIGELLEISEGTSKSQLSRAKAVLREMLKSSVTT